jgi:nicotinamide-nucleotide amidase
VKAALVIIGDEIVSGQKIDTNSSLVASRLGEIGVSLSEIIAVGDSLPDIVRELRRAADGHDLVVATGGLGPTHDDLTREALGQAFGRKLVLDAPTLAYIEERFRNRGLEAPDNIRTLALVPEGAQALANPAGTAPGLLLETRRGAIYVLPGVPREVEAIFAGEVLEAIGRRFGGSFIKTRTLRTVGITELEIAGLIAALIPTLQVRLAFLPEDTGVKLTLAARSESEGEAARVLDQAAGAIAGAIGERVYSTAGEELHTVVGRLLIDKRMTIATAESCTGGLIAHLLTEVPGISACLERGIVAYSNQAKVDVLGVDRDLIRRHGAVSEEVALSMACGVRERAGTDLGVATTGIAGPTGGGPDKPVGLVWLALADRGGCQAVRHVLAGDRALVKRRAAARTLDLVRCHLGRQP